MLSGSPIPPREVENTERMFSRDADLSQELLHLIPVTPNAPFSLKPTRKRRATGAVW